MTIKRITKKEYYARYGLVYDSKTQTINTPIPAARLITCTEILQPGNSKTGAAVLTVSTLATNKLIATDFGMIRGTCCCTCKDCYACTGCYTFKDVKNALAIRTILARDYIDFMERAICAQLDYIAYSKPGYKQEIRISAAGDLFSADYVEMFKRIIARYPQFVFWTYTKYDQFVNAFDQFDNANIVKSILPSGALNYGTVSEIFTRYIELVDAGYNPHICSCGVRDYQHCAGCAGCAVNDYVLFFKHSARDYDIQKDQLFDFAAMVCEMIRNSAPQKDIIAVMRAGLEIENELKKDGARRPAVLKFKKPGKKNAKKNAKKEMKKAA